MALSLRISSIEFELPCGKTDCYMWGNDAKQISPLDDQTVAVELNSGAYVLIPMWRVIRMYAVSESDESDGTFEPGGSDTQESLGRAG